MELEKTYFTKLECNEIINYSENIATHDWERINNINNKYFIKDISKLELTQNVFQRYINKNLPNYKIDNIGVYILKYLKGDFFGRHMDKGNTEFAHDAISNINTILNDEYEGGEFYLDDLLYKKPIGEIYNYDSITYHEVKPITNGTRYSLLCFLRTRNIKKKEIKSLL